MFSSVSYLFLLLTPWMVTWAPPLSSLPSLLGRLLQLNREAAADGASCPGGSGKVLQQLLHAAGARGGRSLQLLSQVSGRSQEETSLFRQA